jgi:hypothetical protein
VIATQTRFDCTTQFKKEPWAQMSYQTSALPAGVLAAITPDLTRVNASRIPGARAEPKIWTGDQQATVVTTDLFAFDNSTDFYKLQGLGQVCELGDAMVGNAMQDCPGVDWYAVSHASDPRIANPDGDIKVADHKLVRSIPSGARLRRQRVSSQAGPSSMRGSTDTESPSRSRRSARAQAGPTSLTPFIV